jgi:hypothetical protein
MVQLGWNAGPRHARVFGLAKSYRKKVDPETMVAHDEDIIAALTIMWALVRSVMPSEVMDGVEKDLEESGLPRLATCNIDEGM